MLICPYGYDKTMTKNNMGKKGFVLKYRLESFTEGGQGKSLQYRPLTIAAYKLGQLPFYITLILAPLTVD